MYFLPAFGDLIPFYRMLAPFTHFLRTRTLLFILSTFLKTWPTEHSWLMFVEIIDSLIMTILTSLTVTCLPAFLFYFS